MNTVEKSLKDCIKMTVGETIGGNHPIFSDMKALCENDFKTHMQCEKDRLRLFYKSVEYLIEKKGVREENEDEANTAEKCQICGEDSLEKEWELALCDFCTHTTHISCYPPLTFIPSGHFACVECANKAIEEMKDLGNKNSDKNQRPNVKGALWSIVDDKYDAWESDNSDNHLKNKNKKNKNLDIKKNDSWEQINQLLRDDIVEFM